MCIEVKQAEQSSWILNEDNEFECTHDNRIVETFEVDTLRNGEHDTYKVRVYVCTDCGAELEGDPEVDRAEMMASEEG